MKKVTHVLECGLVLLTCGLSDTDNSVVNIVQQIMQLPWGAMCGFPMIFTSIRSHILNFETES